MPCKIINNSGLEIAGFEDMIQSLVSFSQDRFGFEKPPTLFLNSDPANAENMLGKTAYYDPEQREIHVYTTDRHPKDIMRSISHELVHHHQNCKGDFAGDHYSGEGYAQKDPHMRKMEKEAYLQGNMCFRDWEDSYKQKQQVYNEWRTNAMSLKEWKNKELFGLLSQKWGFGKNLVTEVKGEKGDADSSDEEENKKMVKGPDGKMVPDYVVDGKGEKDKADQMPKGDVKKEQLDEEELDEAFGRPEVVLDKIKKADCDDLKSMNSKHFTGEVKSAYDAAMAKCSDNKEQLDEEEVDETVRAYDERNAAQHASQGGDRVAGKLEESIYNRFRKLIK